MTHTPLKIRASSAGKLMTEPRLKSEAGSLSETAKTYLKELFITKEYGRTKDITNKFIEKGLLNEELAIDEYSLHTNSYFEKNEILFDNDYFIGTPDNATDKIRDFKCSFDLWTFMNAELTPLYYYQLQTYMDLTGIRHAELIYVLSNSPEATIQRELKTASWKLQVSELPDFEAKLRREMCYDDIPREQRIKVFPVEYNPDDIIKMRDKVIKAREYYSTLKL